MCMCNVDMGKLAAIDIGSQDRCYIYIYIYIYIFVYWYMLASNCNHFYLYGDFNINLLDHTYNKHVKYSIEKPRRMANDNNSLIDNI